MSVASTTRTIHYVRNPRGISSQTDYYARTATADAPASVITLLADGTPRIPSNWSADDTPLDETHRYKWRQTLTRYTDGTYSVSPPVCIANYSLDGADGADGADGLNATEYSLVCNPSIVVRQSVTCQYSDSTVAVSVARADGDETEMLDTYAKWNSQGLAVVMKATVIGGTQYWQVFVDSASLPLSESAQGGAPSFEILLYRKKDGFPSIRDQHMTSAPTSAQGTLIARQTIPIVGDGAAGATGAMGPKVRYLKWQDIMAKMQASPDYRFKFLSGSDESGSYDSPVTAAENIQYYDIVWYDDGTAHNWYLCKKGYQASSSSSTPRSDTGHWQASDTNMGFIATDVFFASRAYVRNLAADDIYIQDGSGNVIVELNSERQVMRGNVIANTLTLGAKALKTYNKTQLAAAFSDVANSLSSYKDSTTNTIDYDNVPDAAFGQALAAASLENAALGNLTYSDEKCVNKALQWKGAGYGFHWLPAVDAGASKVCEVFFYTKDSSYAATSTSGVTTSVNVPVIFCGATEDVKIGTGGNLTGYNRLLRMPLYTGRYRFVGFCLDGDYIFYGDNKRWAKAVEQKADGTQETQRMMWVDVDNEYPALSYLKGRVYVYTTANAAKTPNNLTACSTEGSTYYSRRNTYWCLSTDLDGEEAVEKMTVNGLVDQGGNSSGICYDGLELAEGGSNTRGPATYFDTLL